MKLHRAWRVAALSLVVALVAGVTPAFAATGRAAVANNVSYNGVLLQGMSESQVESAINGSLPAAPAMSDLIVTDGGKQFPFDTEKALKANVAAMVDQAYRSDVGTVTAYAITPVFKVDSAVVNEWTAKVAKGVDRSAKNAKRVLKKKRLVFVKSSNGYKVDKTATAKAITASINAALAANSPGPAPVVATVKAIKPKVTSKNINKALLVVLSERRIYLYKGSKLEKKYRCAIGTKSHPTPTGDWKIVRKVKNPTWRNPAPNGWGKNMPAVIKPGPRNPLGMRALYLNASGIRIHGTYKSWSIGTAASHGCMRMKHKDVANLYPRVPVGTPIKIIK